MDGKQLILIIEDDKSLAAGLCRALQSEEIEAVSCGSDVATQGNKSHSSVIACQRPDIMEPGKSIFI